MNFIVDQTYYANRKPGTKSDRVIRSTIDEILGIVESKIGIKENGLQVLDVGSGSGEYCLEIAKKVKLVIGVEPYYEGYAKAILENTRSNLTFVNSLIEDFKTDLKFDLILSLATIEHMPDSNKSFEKIFSLMRKGGIIYLTAPNKWWPFESHYHLPFLAMLPLPVANFYLKITNKGSSYESCSYSKSYFEMKEFFNQFDCSYEFLVPNHRAEYLGCGQDNKRNFYLRYLGIWLIKKVPLMWMFSKGFIMVIRKN